MRVSGYPEPMFDNGGRTGMTLTHEDVLDAVEALGLDPAKVSQVHFGNGGWEVIPPEGVELGPIETTGEAVGLFCNILGIPLEATAIHIDAATQQLTYGVTKTW